MLMWTMARTQHPLALPAALLGIVAAFHGVLLAAGVSLQEAQDAGWVLKPAVRGAGWGLWLRGWLGRTSRGCMPCWQLS